MKRIVLSIVTFFMTFQGFSENSQTPYVARDFSYLLDMPGWNRDLLRMHFSLYEGYVKNTNLIIDELKQLNKIGANRTFDYGAIKRCFGWEFDGMRLHELYFEAFTQNSDKGSVDASLNKQIERDFGSYDAWKNDFIATGLIKGIGWAILYKDPSNGKLYNVWINEHDGGNLVQGIPLLVLDVWEHAYITQFGLNRKGYIELFFKSLDWHVVNERWLTTHLKPFAHFESDQNNDSQAQ